MAVLIIMPQEAPLYPIVIWLCMIVLCGFIIHKYWYNNSPNQRVIRLPQNYRKTQNSALLSTVLFLLTCISFKFISQISIPIFSALIFATILCITNTILSHIKLLNRIEKKPLTDAKIGIKYSWLIISLISYYYARSLTSNILDIPFDTTSNKLITAVFALFFIFTFYLAIYLAYISYLANISPKIKKSKSSTSDNLRYSMSFFAPLFLIGYISLIVLCIQTNSIINFGIKFAVMYDARDTFFCNNKYMWLSEYSDARFMFITDGNYRALIPHHDDFGILRLTCTTSEPFYSLVAVQNKEDVMLTVLRKQAEILASDIKMEKALNVQ